MRSVHGDALASRQSLPAHPSSVPAARLLIRNWLSGTGHEALTDDAELAVSELVTNALVHAGTPVEMSARLDLDFLRVEVADGSTNLPRLRRRLLTSGTGRGLRLLGRTVDRWGAHLEGPGKVVWFELSAGDDGAHAIMEQPDVVPSVDTVPVELLDVPLLLHAAWHENAEALLRELLLVRLDDREAESSLEDHAAANDALTLLSEQIPAAALGEDPSSVLMHAVSPSVTAERLVLRVPVDSVPHFEVLDSALDDAVVLAENGRLLTLPTQPEVRQMRRWLCGEVRQQAAGGPATPWVSSARPPPAAWVAALEWDTSTVDGSPAALVAADDTNRIVAVSASALEILGFDNRGALVGQRLVGLIPARYHQAHLAGFTLHLSNGRSPLLDVPLTVPVLLRDGSERMVHLTVTSQHLPGGRRVFVAEMVPTSE